MNTMTAIDYLMHPQSADDSELKEVCDIAIEALEKQVPKKPLNQSEEYDRMYGNCPCCGEMVVDYPDDFIVCSNCGQCLDWGEEE